MIVYWPVIVALLIAAPGQNASMRASLDASQDPLSRARTLYGAAQYEDALASLPAMPQAGQEDDVDRYRMLCLLALGRTAEAEQAIERALVRNPGFAVLPTDVSPRVVQFFNDVRKRVLPARAEAVYARARADYDDRKYYDAANRFSLVLELLSDPDVASTGKMADLRLVAEEFRRLSRERLPENLRAGTGAQGAEVYDYERVFSRLSTNVKPPVEISRRMPEWDPPRDQAWRTFRGVIELVIDRRGRVEDVRLLERIAPFYDAALIKAAREWVFQPATRAGQPVRYRHQIEITMRPAN